MEILKIKINPKHLRISFLNKNGLLIFLVLIGIANIFLEFIFRNMFQGIWPDSLTEILHIIIYFIIPFAFAKRKLNISNYLFIILFFLLTSVLYVFINLKLIPEYFYFSYLLILFLLLFYLFKEKETAESLLVKISSWKETAFYLVLAIALCVGHLYFVLSLSHIFQIQRLNYISQLPNISYMTFATFGMEVFYRGFIFRKLNSAQKIPFWISASITTILYIGPFLTNPSFTNNTALLVSTTFYLLLLGFIFCALVKKTKSILPSYILSLIMSILRYLIIFGPI